MVKAFCSRENKHIHAAPPAPAPPAPAAAAAAAPPLPRVHKSIVFFKPIPQ